ncbi:MAG: hypothetical protein EWM72_02459 [Nitrospira sp.]|nr:MAG: hypothetical protein EWM72_02459 [Nitrospira sp.]
MVSQPKMPPIWLAKLSTFCKELHAVRWPVSPAAGILEGCRLSDLGRTIFQATLQTQYRTASPEELAVLRDRLEQRWDSELRRVFSR